MKKPRELPRVDKHMSDADLTAAAELLSTSIDWRRLPELDKLLRERPLSDRLWHELVGFALQTLENPIQRPRRGKR